MKPLIIFIITLLSFTPQSLKQSHDVDGVYEDDYFVILRFSPDKQIITCYKNADGEVIGDFFRLKQHVKSTGHEIIFACNGGMFMADLRPLGLYIEDGNTIMPLNTRSASTNFYMKPNGVFCVMPDGSCTIKTTNDYKMSQISPQFATQSGPMLTINGHINSKFNPESTSYRVRNGVGVQSNGDVVFILSKIPVNFYELASAFQIIGCDNSLFLDGDISDFYCPEIGYTGMFAYMSTFIVVIK